MFGEIVGGLLLSEAISDFIEMSFHYPYLLIFCTILLVIIPLIFVKIYQITIKFLPKEKKTIKYILLVLAFLSIILVINFGNFNMNKIMGG